MSLFIGYYGLVMTFVLWAQKGRVDFGPAGEGVGAIYDIKSSFDSNKVVFSVCMCSIGCLAIFDIKSSFDSAV